MKKKLPAHYFRAIVEEILRQAIAGEYLNSILDHETGSGATIIDLIKTDVEETSAWQDKGYYNNDDVRLAIGRVLAKHIGL
jgi:hypothetical protein